MKILSALLSFFKGIPIKVWAYTALVGMMTAFVWQAYDRVWDAGYNQAQLDFNKQVEVIQNEAVRKARDQWERSAAAALAQLAGESRLAEEAAALESTVDGVVDGLPGACRRATDDEYRLFNEAISGPGKRERASENPSEPSP